jgi:glycosyltransferase involved in cell wall biosynthesis
MAPKIILSANKLWFLYNFYGGLIKEIQKLGYDVHVIGGGGNIDYESLKEMDVSVTEIPFVSKSGNPLKNLSILVNYIKIFKKIRPACVLNFTIKANIYGAAAARLFSVPCINTQPGSGTVFLYNNFVSLTAKILYKSTQKYPEKIFVLNKEDYDLLTNNKLVPKNKVEIIPGSGIDMEKFSPMPDNGRRNADIQVLYIGRILKDKGIYELIDALRMLKNENINFTCRLVGFVDDDNVSAVSIDAIRAWEHEGLVKYEGSTNDVRPFIAECDVVVLPSSYGEGLPQSLMEASSMEKIVIATNIQGCKDVVSDGYNGYLCEAKNSKSLFEAIKKVLALSPEERIAMGRNGRKYMGERFEKSIIYRKYLELIESICRK